MQGANFGICVLEGIRITRDDTECTHGHCQGRDASGLARTKHKAAYPEPLCRAYAAALRTGWSKGHRAKVHSELPSLWLPDVLAKVNITYEEISAKKKTRELPDPPAASVVRGVVALRVQLGFLQEKPHATADVEFDELEELSCFELLLNPSEIEVLPSPFRLSIASLISSRLVEKGV